jgi:hypothetical protein
MFNATVLVSEELNRKMVNMVQELAERCVHECASKYGFDGAEAVRFLNLTNVKMERKTILKTKNIKREREIIKKAAFPLPYNGEVNENCCYALRQNNGLYTQCTGVKKTESKFCKSCATTMQKTGSEMPEYGTIQDRQATGIFEFVDPKGRRPIAYTKVMKKYKISEEQAIEEAGKFNITINSEHFVAPEEAVKRGRPSNKAEKEQKVKGTKGRPKKSKKVLEIEGDEEDLFASLVAQANEESEEVEVIKKKGKSDEEKEAERLAKEAEKEAKKQAAEKAKAEKEAKLAAEKAEKEAKLASEKAEKEAKLAAAKAEKEAKLAAEKAEKEAKKAALEEAKKAKEAAKKVKPTTEKEDDEEPDVVKKIEFEGKKYLKSKKTGIIYDYTEYTKNGEQVVVGKWNETSNKIDFSEPEDEEEEDEYDM